MWRALSAGAYPQIDAEAWLVSGVRHLRNYRQGDGNGAHRWRTFPFYYTILALSEFDYPDVISELRYARPSLERVANGKRTPTEISLRRRTLAERILMRL